MSNAAVPGLDGVPGFDTSSAWIWNSKGVATFEAAIVSQVQIAGNIPAATAVAENTGAGAENAGAGAENAGAGAENAGEGAENAGADAGVGAGATLVITAATPTMAVPSISVAIPTLPDLDAGSSSPVATVEEDPFSGEPATSVVSRSSVVEVEEAWVSTKTSSETGLVRSSASTSATITMPGDPQFIAPTPSLSSVATRNIKPEAAFGPSANPTFETVTPTPSTELLSSGSLSRTTGLPSSPGSSSLTPTTTNGTSAGVKAAIALGVTIFVLIIGITIGIVWKRKRKNRRQYLPELATPGDKRVGRFELAIGHSKTNSRGEFYEKPADDLVFPPPASDSYGSFSSDGEPLWRPGRWSRWRARQELDGGWKPPEMEGRKFHEKSVT